MFITVEGIEGSGKSTHVGFLARALEEASFRVCLTREPGGTALGERIRALLLHDSLATSQWAELFLILADRAEHVEAVIRPALARGEIVLCDRYSESTLAYQAYGGGLPLEVVRAVEASARHGLLPDLTFVLDCPTGVGLQRTSRRRGDQPADRFESEERSFHERVRNGFLALAREAPERIRIVNADRPIDEVRAEILAETRRRLAA